MDNAMSATSLKLKANEISKDVKHFKCIVLMLSIETAFFLYYYKGQTYRKPEFFTWLFIVVPILISLLSKLEISKIKKLEKENRLQAANDKIKKDKLYLQSNKKRVLENFYFKSNVSQMVDDDCILSSFVTPDIEIKTLNEWIQSENLNSLKAFKMFNKKYRNQINCLKNIKKIPYRLINVDLDKLTGADFEKEVAKHYKILGYDAVVSGGSDDKGVDIYTTSPKKLIIQCKRYGKGSKVQSKDVQIIAGATLIDHYKGFKPIIITNRTLTNNAKSHADKIGVEVIERNELLNLMSNTVLSGTLVKPYQFVQKLNLNISYYDFCIKVLPLIKENLSEDEFTSLNRLYGQLKDEKKRNAIDKERRKYWAQRKGHFINPTQGGY